MCMAAAVSKDREPGVFARELKKLKVRRDGYVLLWKVVAFAGHEGGDIFLRGPYQYDYQYLAGENRAKEWNAALINGLGDVCGGVLHCFASRAGARKYKCGGEVLLGVLVKPEDILCIGGESETWQRRSTVPRHVGVRSLVIHEKTYAEALRLVRGYLKKIRREDFA